MASSKEMATKDIFYDLALWDVSRIEHPVVGDIGSRNIELIQQEGGVSYNEQRIPPSLSAVRDVNDSITTSVLVEHETVHGYGLKAQLTDVFDTKKYLREINVFPKVLNRLVLKVPSRVFLTHEHEFGISVRIGKSRPQGTENIVLKLLSPNFLFSEGMVQLTEVDKEVLLTKSDYFQDYTITARIYCNNEIIYESELSLIERK